MRSQVLLLLLLLLALAGCARFEPRPISASDLADQLESRSLTNAELKVFLERNLHREFAAWPPATWDLDTLTYVAFYYHSSLAVARANWKVALGGEETAAERPNPTASASGIYEPAKGAYSPWIPGVTFDLPIETAGKRKFRREQAQHLTESARLNIASAAWQVRSQLRSALLGYVIAHEKVKLLLKEQSLRENLLKRLSQQHLSGALSASDLHIGRLALQRANTDLASAEQAEAEARPLLAASLGVFDAALDDVVVTMDLGTNTLAQAQSMSARDVRRVALLGRADILQGLSDYAASQSALQLAVAGQYPDIHLNPGYMWNGGSTGEQDWQIGFTLELPIFNHHHGQVTQAAANREATAARFIALQAQVIAQIDQAVASFRACQKNAAAQQKFLGGLAKRLESAQEQVKAGSVDELELIAAELELNTAQIASWDTTAKLQGAVGTLENVMQRPFELPAFIFDGGQTNSPPAATGLLQKP